MASLFHFDVKRGACIIIITHNLNALQASLRDINCTINRVAFIHVAT